MAEHDRSSVRKEDRQKGTQHSLLKRKLAFRSDINNHPGRGNSRCKGLEAEMMCCLLCLRERKMSGVGASEWNRSCSSELM